MGQISLFQFLTPLMLLVFSGGFAALWLYDRTAHRSAAFFGISYFLAASGFALDVFRNVLPFYVASIGTNSLFISSTVFFSGAVHTRSRQPWPLKSMALVIAVMSAAYGWHLFGDPQITMRALITSFGAAGILALAVPAARQAATNLMSRVIFWLTLITSLQFVIRASLVLALTGDGLTVENYSGSVYVITFHFATAVIGMAFAGALFIAYGMDIVTVLNTRSQIDHLSGLLNRRGFEARARELMAAAARTGGQAPAMVVCDLDHFKRINDRFGHAIGDRVIERMAYAVKTGVIGSAAAGRIGGEEFAVLLPRTTRSMARLWCEGMRAALAAPSEHDDPDCSELPAFTVSFGVASMQAGDTLNTLLARADEALYQAKNDGRNCVRLAAA